MSFNELNGKISGKLLKDIVNKKGSFLRNFSSVIFGEGFSFLDFAFLCCVYLYVCLFNIKPCCHHHHVVQYLVIKMGQLRWGRATRS